MADETEKKAAAADENRSIVTERVVTREVKEPPLGPNATTDPQDPKSHYYSIPNGDGTSRQVNAWGEEKGSPEDKKRW